VELLSQPLASAEFLVVDVETNGRAGPDCELTEVGAVLVGGGELHDRFCSLVAVTRPLGRGIERLTGISQAMVQRAPAPRAVLAELADRMAQRVLVAHSAAFDRRVLQAAFAASGLPWPEPPVLCTVAMARRLAPLAGQRKLAALAGSLGIEVPAVHRALPDAETCARILCALLPRLAAHAPTVGEATALLSPRRPSRRRSGPGVAPPVPPVGLRFDELPDAPGAYVFRDDEGHPLYVGKSISLRTRARSHFRPGAHGGGWTAHAASVEYTRTGSELGALLLENRLIKALRPPGNVLLRRSPDGFVYLRCRLDVAFPVLEVSREPAPGHAVNVGPLRGRAAAVELAEQLSSLFGLRRCSRRLVRREHPSAYGQMGRCLSPCLGDLDPNLYRRRLDDALAVFAAGEDGAARLLDAVAAQMRGAAASRAYERAAWLRRRHRRLRVLLERAGGVLRAAHTGARLVLAPAPDTAPGPGDALWLVGGRLVDWGSRPGAAELAARTERALSCAGREDGRPPGAWLPVSELDELRIVDVWLAAHPEVRPIELDAGVAAAGLGLGSSP